MALNEVGDGCCVTRLCYGELQGLLGATKCSSVCSIFWDKPMLRKVVTKGDGVGSGTTQWNRHSRPKICERRPGSNTIEFPASPKVFRKASGFKTYLSTFPGNHRCR